MEIYFKKDGKPRYREKVRLINGRPITKSFSSKSKAEKWKHKMESQKEDFALGFRRVESVNFSQLVELWFDRAFTHARITENTKYKYRSSLKSVLLPILGSLRSDQIGENEVREVLKNVEQRQMKAKTINFHLSLLRQILRWGHQKGYIRILPDPSLFVIDEPERHGQFFHETEIKALLAGNVGDPVYPMVYLALHSGLRPGEILALKWDRVNFPSNVIEVTRTHTRRGTQEHTKGKRNRYIPMNAMTRPLFESLFRHQAHAEYVFVTKREKPYHPDHFCQRYFHPFCERAGVRKLRFHDLRHSFATHFRMKGGKIEDLKTMLGHRDIRTTEIYSHWSADYLAKASEVVDFGIRFQKDGPSLAHGEQGLPKLTVISGEN